MSQQPQEQPSLPVPNNPEHQPNARVTPDRHTNPAGDVVASGIGEPAGELEWKRAHPLSPLTRMWIIFVALAWVIFKEIIESLRNPDENLLSLLRDIGFSTAIADIGLPILGLSGIVVLSLGLYYWGWFHTRYAVDSTALHLRTGFFVKNYRKANLERIQSVDIEYPLLARIFGLGGITVDVADGSSNALKIEFIKRADANALRTSLLAKVREAKGTDSAGIAPAGIDPTSYDSAQPSTEQEDSRAQMEPAHRSLQQTQQQEGFTSALTEENERQLTRLPTGRLLAGTLLGFELWTRMLIAIAIIGAATWATGSFMAALFANLVVLFGAIASIWGSFNKRYNFRISHSPEGLKIRRGFTNSTTQAVPTGRIQALEISQPFFWKYFGWYTVSMNVAGYGLNLDSDSVAKTDLLVIATAPELAQVLPYVIHQRSADSDDVAQLQTAMDGAGAEQGFTPAPKNSRYFDPLSYKRNGWGMTERFLLIRRGVLVRRLTVLPHQCIQSIELHEGPLQKRTDLATLTLHSVPGPVSPEAKNISATDARELLTRY